MNIDTLKCFILVAENLSFARAAEALYISQPAVTKQINTLEAELGTALFIRSTRHVELTPAGMSFYKDAKDIVQKSQSAVDRIRLANPGTHSLKIGLSNATTLKVLSPVLQALHEAYPEILPNIEVLTYKTILSLFMENKLDVLFYYKENLTKTAGIRFIELKKDPLLCMVPAKSPLAKKPLIGMEDLKDENFIACNPLNAPLMIAEVQQKLLKHCQPEDVIYCNTVEIAHCMTAAGMGITILPETLCAEGNDIVTVPFESEKTFSFGCFYHTKSKNHSLQNFLQML